MTDNIAIRKIARKKTVEAWKQYELQRIGLGDDFVLCVEESLEKISRNPRLYPVIHKSYVDH